MQNIFYILTVSFLFAAGCKTESVVNVATQPIEIERAFTKTPFTIEDVKIVGDTLFAQVLYSGGCGDHYFEIESSGFLLKSLPPKQPVKIIHYSTNDPCRAFINKDLTFDISDFRGSPNGTTVLLLENWNNDIIYSY
tara:strand:+ start:52 stop:462 length:411 start_codon:yes stop_codon:yes gene_type:complete